MDGQAISPALARAVMQALAADGAASMSLLEVAPGQMLAARVVDAQGGQVELALAGQRIVASTDLPLAAGDTVRLQVATADAQQVTLRVVPDEAATTPAAELPLPGLGESTSQALRAAINALPATPDTPAAPTSTVAARAVAAGVRSPAQADALVRLTAAGLPATPAAVGGMAELVEGPPLSRALGMVVAAVTDTAVPQTPGTPVPATPQTTPSATPAAQPAPATGAPPAPAATVVAGPAPAPAAPPTDTATPAPPVVAAPATPTAPAAPAPTADTPQPVPASVAPPPDATAPAQPATGAPAPAPAPASATPAPGPAPATPPAPAGAPAPAGTTVAPQTPAAAPAAPPAATTSTTAPEATPVHRSGSALADAVDRVAHRAVDGTPDGVRRAVADLGHGMERRLHAGEPVEHNVRSLLLAVAQDPATPAHAARLAERTADALAAQALAPGAAQAGATDTPPGAYLQVPLPGGQNAEVRVLPDAEKRDGASGGPRTTRVAFLLNLSSLGQLVVDATVGPGGTDATVRAASEPARAFLAGRAEQLAGALSASAPGGVAARVAVERSTAGEPARLLPAPPATGLDRSA